MVTLLADDEHLTLQLDAPLNAAASRALRRLEDDETLAMVAASAVALRFPLARWHRVGHLPGKGADTEELDHWAARHEALAILFGKQTQQVHVDVQGHIGGADCRLVIVVDGELSSPGPRQLLRLASCFQPWLWPRSSLDCGLISGPETHKSSF